MAVRLPKDAPSLVMRTRSKADSHSRPFRDSCPNVVTGLPRLQRVDAVDP
ncbi:hypothetical protein JYK04_00415 [Streptomyces nojiriensis]|nr:hypothetical protein JYK04_00415 [Streptomyces nojiriensis]